MVDALSCLDPGKSLTSMPSPLAPSSPQSADVLVSEVLEMSEVLEVLEVLEMLDLLVSSLPPAPPPLVPRISYSEMSVLQQSCPKVQNLRQSSALMRVGRGRVNCFILHLQYQ